MKQLFLFSAVSLLLLSACSDNFEDVNGGAPGTSQEEAYFSLRLSFPDGSSDMRATTDDEDGDGYQTGLGTEQRFQTVAAILVDASNTVVSYVNYISTDFAPEGTSPVDDNSIEPNQTPKTYHSITPRKVAKGDSRVYIFLNPTAEMSTRFAVGSTVQPGFKEEIVALTASSLTGTYARDDNFLMANATTPPLTTIDGTQTTPTVAVVNVERFVAKLVESTTTTDFDITNKMNATTVTAKLVNYGYGNLNKRAYYAKQTETRSDAGAFPGAYVVDPNFVQADYNSVSPAYPWYGNDFFVIGNQEVNRAFTVNPVIEYCLENTMISNEQYINKTTSVGYKAELNIDGHTGTFYTYKNVIHTTYASLETEYNNDYPGIPNALATLFTEDEVTDAYTSTTNYTSLVLGLNDKLLAKGIRCYYNGECYYSWPIKHWEQDALLGRMEFGIVRNNVYYLTVTNILNIGEPWYPGGPEDPEKPTVPTDPGKPDEDDDAYIRLELKVLPWVVRTNDIEF